MHIIDKLITEAREIIRVDRGEHVKPIFEEVERFLAEHKVPVRSTYESNNFWKYEAYPIHGFSNLATIIKDELLPNLEGVTLYNYVFRYIYRINLDRYSLAVFTNIFGTGQNSKYSFETFEGPGRLNKELTMQYVHPKYILEELLRKMYMPSNYENLGSLIEEKKSLLAEWNRLNPKVNFEAKMEEVDGSFKKDQTSLMNKVGKILVAADYDPSIPVYIGSAADIAKCEHIARDMFPELEVTRNASKSFFDPRTINHIFKNRGHILIKIWELLDHEIIPILPYNTTRMVAHISVVLKLALTEHITYDILDFREIANEKLKIFIFILQKEQDMLAKGIYVSTLNCKYIGRYYPVDKYITNMRASNAAKFSSNNNKK